MNFLTISSFGTHYCYHFFFFSYFCYNNNRTSRLSANRIRRGLLSFSRSHRHVRPPRPGVSYSGRAGVQCMLVFVCLLVFSVASRCTVYACFCLFVFSVANTSMIFSSSIIRQMYAKLLRYSGGVFLFTSFLICCTCVCLFVCVP